MNKNAIQKYAIWARNELIEQVKQRAYQYGISEKSYGDEHATVIAGRVLSADEKQQRNSFVNEIKKVGYKQAVEEVAYTWFNRFVALRFMEVNDYLPTHVRVFSDASGGFNPEILKDVLQLDLDGLDKAKVSELLNANKTEELYRYLLLTQCNALNAALPEMFEKLGSYTEMLLPNNILKQDSVLARLVKDIDEDDWKDAVQIIGWMYQYYNTELFNALFDGELARQPLSKVNVPAATQLFTPDWVVRTMVENSLGRLWLESHPNAALKANWKYYLDEAEQTPEVAERLRVLRAHSPVKSPEDIRLIDPCMGSGHMLVYAFDVLVQIYESVGVSPRDAAKLILEKNIYGLDIDRRAYQLAYFSLMMKARQYNRRILTDGVKPQVYQPTGFSDGEEYGAVLKVDSLPQRPEEPKEYTLFTEQYETSLNAWNFKRLLAQKYDVVVTNPPYMSSPRMSSLLSFYVQTHYKEAKADMSAVVYLAAIRNLLKSNGFISFVTTNSWMFLKSFEKLRLECLQSTSFEAIIDYGTELFEGKIGHLPIIAWVSRKSTLKKKFRAIRLVDYNYSNRGAKEDEYFKDKNRYTAQQEDFRLISGSPFAYWISPKILESFASSDNIGNLAEIVSGMTTGNNEAYLRLWYEVSISSIAFGKKHIDDVNLELTKWIPYHKGGEQRKWYGNNAFIVNWSQSKNFNRAKTTMTHVYLQPCVTWSDISGTNFAGRFCTGGFMFDVKGSCAFGKTKDLVYLIGLFNSKLTPKYVEALNPTTTTQVGDLKRIPLLPYDNTQYVMIESTSLRNIDLSTIDWDYFETSWDFKRHPLLCGERTVAAAFSKWENEAAERFDTLKANEEELNRIFIDIYGLSDELTPEVEDKEVTVRRADLGREIRSLISYAVGCMFGRYSLDWEGLAYAGGDWDASKYKTFPVDKDNIIPVCDDEYFDDDIVGRFVDFVRTVYGADTLEENLKFIADALGGKGTPREVIRNYFLNDFYKDHVKIYQKHPIYWLFDSGKKNGFKALIYMHRYSRDLLAKLRTDYVHEQQERYRTQLSHISNALNTATGAERAKFLKQQDKLTEQLREVTAYEEKVHHLADQNIAIDLDDGVKKNYEIFADVLAKI